MGRVTYAGYIGEWQHAASAFSQTEKDGVVVVAYKAEVKNVRAIIAFMVITVPSISLAVFVGQRWGWGLSVTSSLVLALALSVKLTAFVRRSGRKFRIDPNERTISFEGPEKAASIPLEDVEECYLTTSSPSEDNVTGPPAFHANLRLKDGRFFGLIDDLDEKLVASIVETVNGLKKKG